MIKGKTPEQIRTLFNIQNESVSTSIDQTKPCHSANPSFTPEEEEQIRRENEWAEE